jgi:hypothetical protein
VRKAKGREHRCGVRRRHDRPEEDRLEPREVEQRLRGDADEQRGDDDAERAQHRRRGGNDAESAPGRLEPALEQDEREADDPDLARTLGVVEFDAARSVRAQQHPEHEERNENGHPGPRRRERGECARGQDRADDEEDESFVHPHILSGGLLPRWDAPRA